MISFVVYFASLRCLSVPSTRRFGSFVLLLFQIAADAALKEEHVIDGRTIDVKRAVPRDRAPQPRLVSVVVPSNRKSLGWGDSWEKNQDLFCTFFKLKDLFSFALFSAFHVTQPW